MAKKNPPNERSDADRRVRQCDRLARLMQLLHLISGRGRWDAAALAEELECSTRTIHRLLQTLSMAGVPWFFDEKIRAYRIRPGYKFPMLDTPTRTIKEKPEQTELIDLTNKLLQEGEAFANTLQKFLAALKESTDRKSD
ncbi:MAG: HTH domain-containing protein [Planctomycetaceae bacterium]|nr:HTH domain-containing protein [Planctomycetaceae bacterium]